MKKKTLSLVLCFVLLLSLLSGCTSYPEETRMAKEYLGMTFGEIKALWGSDCTLGGDLYDGAKKGICYEDGRTPYIFLFDTEATDVSGLSDDAVVALVRAPSGKGKPCENPVLPNGLSIAYIDNLTAYSFAINIGDDSNATNIFYLGEESVAVNYIYHRLANPADSVYAYEVSEIPPDRQYRQYYFETDENVRRFFFTYGAFPPEDWDGESEAPNGVQWYHNEFGEWPDPDAIDELIETGTWPEDTYTPHPYDDIQKIEFYNEFGFYPAETGWDHSWPSYNEICYWKDYGEWPDPKAVDTFLSTGHWPEDAYVPFPYSDSRLLETYNRTGKWPEGTDLSALPPLPEE